VFQAQTGNIGMPEIQVRWSDGRIGNYKRHQRTKDKQNAARLLRLEKVGECLGKRRLKIGHVSVVTQRWMILRQLLFLSDSLKGEPRSKQHYRNIFNGKWHCFRNSANGSFRGEARPSALADLGRSRATTI
jgi:hypothetical protein